MRFPTVNQCCCGCTLYMGTLIIGILATIGSVFKTLNSIFGEGTETVATTIINTLFKNQTLEDNSTQEELVDLIHHIRPAFITIDAIVAVHYAIWLVVCIAFLYGTVKSVPSLLLPWLVTTFIVCIIFLVDFTIVSIVVMVHYSVGFGVLILFIILIGMIFDAYFLTVVYSFYLQLKTQRKPKYTETPNFNA